MKDVERYRQYNLFLWLKILLLLKKKKNCNPKVDGSVKLKTLDI